VRRASRRDTRHSGSDLEPGDEATGEAETVDDVDDTAGEVTLEVFSLSITVASGAKAASRGLDRHLAPSRSGVKSRLS
jgi:hypothetical protein